MSVSRKNRETAAARLEITLEEYEQKRDAGLLWCSGCKAWHQADLFPGDRSRASGKGSSCRESRKRYQKEKWYPENREGHATRAKRNMRKLRQRKSEK